MADPTGYEPSYSFDDFQGTHPTRPLPGQNVDDQLADISAAIESLRLAVMDIRRSDGRLKNRIVTPESLGPGFVLASQTVAEGDYGGVVVSDGGAQWDLGAAAVKPGTIAAGAVTGDAIAPGTVTAEMLAGDVLDEDNIADGAIVSSKLASGAVTDEKVASGIAASKSAFTSPATGTQTVQNMLGALRRQAREFGILAANSAAANTTGMNAAIAWVNANGGYVEFEPVAYNFNGASLNPITASTGGFIGQGDFALGTRFRNNSPTGHTLDLSGAQHFVVANIWFCPAVFRNAGTFEVRIRNSSYCCRVQNCRADYCANGFLIESSSECEIIDCQTRYITDANGVKFSGTLSLGSYRARIANLKANNPYPNAYGTVRAWAATTAFNLNDIISANGKVWQCVQAGTSGASSPSSYPTTSHDSPFTALIVDGSVRWKFVCSTGLNWILQDSYAYSLVIQKAAVLNGYHGFVQADGANTGSSYPIWCWADGLECDHSFAENVLLNGGEGFYASLSWFGSSLTANGVTIAAAHKGEVSIGAGTRIAAAWQHGVFVNAGPVCVTFDGCFVGANSVGGSGTYHGVCLGPNVTDVSFSGGRYGSLPGIGTNNQGYGIFVDTGSSRIRIDPSVNTHGNVTGRISAASPIQALSHFLPNYSNDSAAASGGVLIGDLYRTDSAVKVRTT